tara:strand:+ start:263 stop:451 length:189 start_codon:yes stop_codon:yes gene_type:complete
MVKLPKIGRAVTMLNVGIVFLGFALGIAPLIGLSLPGWVAPAGWVLLGVAGVLFLMGRKKLF